MRHRSAFTVIELLVVVTLIVVLIALLLPTLAAARRAGQSAQCLSNLRQIGIAKANYGADHDDYYPLHMYIDSPASDPRMGFMTTIPASITWSSVTQNGYNNWLWLLYPYHEYPKLYLCPAALRRSFGWTYGQANYQSALVKTNGQIVGTDEQPVGSGQLRFGLPRLGTERHIRNKIYFIDGYAGEPNGTRAIFSHAGFLGTGHVTNANALFVGGHALTMSLMHPALVYGADPGQTWFRPDVVSKDY